MMDRYLELLGRLVQMESPSRDSARLRALADLLVEEAHARGGRAERVPAGDLGDHLSIEFFAKAGDGAPLLVIGHIDTVHPVGTLENHPFSVSTERITGPGVYDMKAGVAAAFEAVSRISERGASPAGPVRLLVTCDEEIGSPSSRPLIEDAARDARAALVLEPCVPGGKAKTARKGVAGYSLQVSGKAAHAGIEPEVGANAIHELVTLLGRVQAFGNGASGTTVNVGRFEGGTVSNVVADRASAEVDVRFWTGDEATRVDQAMRDLEVADTRCTLRLRGGINRLALEETPESQALFERASAEAADLGFKLEGARTGGASDGNFVSAVGCATLDGLGPDGAGAHSADEYVLMPALPTRLALITRLMEVL